VALAALDAFANLVTGGNYMYLRHTPDMPNLLDLLGGWPWYIVAAAGLAVAIFIVLDLPFSIGRFRLRHAPASLEAKPLR
jgi:uncharacterized membrane protein YwaF